ncbi:MAG: hypothetical protein WD981_02810, partial [Gaiellaceae bacterium]
MDVVATNQTDATSKATGISANISGDTQIGAAVGFNYVVVDNLGSIGDDSTVSGVGVSVGALTPAGERNDIVAWGLAAAGGGSDANVAASIGINYVDYESVASIGAGSTIASGGYLKANASAPMGLQNIAASGAAGTGGGVGAGLAINIVTVHTDAYIGAGVVATAAGPISVSALSGLAVLPIPGIPLLDPPPEFTSVAVSGSAGTGDFAIAGSVIIDVLDLRTRAWIGDGVRINETGPIPAGSSAEVLATDVTAVKNLAGGVAVTTGSAGVGMALIVSVVNKDVRASIGKSVVLRVGGDVRVEAVGGFEYFALSASLGGSTSAAVSGSIVVAVFNKGSGDPGIRAFVDGGTPGTAATIVAGDELIVRASAPNDYELFAGNIAIGSSAGIGVSAVIFVNDGIVEAYVAAHDTLSAGAGGITVEASQSEDMILLAIGGSVGGTAGVAGSVIVDVLTLETRAYIDDDATVASAGKIAVSASDHTDLKGIAGQLAISGSAGVGLGADVEVNTKVTEAWIGERVTATAGGNVTVDATSSETLLSISVGAAGGGAAGVSVNAAVSVIDITTLAYIGADALVDADGSVRVQADEALKLDMIAGNFSGAGSAAVGAAASVPIVNKTTIAYIGDRAIVTGRGFGTGLTVKSGAYQVTTIDTRFDPADAVEGGGVLNLGFQHGFEEGQEVVYDNGGGTSITGLTHGGVYYVDVIDSTRVKLSSTPGGSAILVSGGSGQSHRLVPTDQAGVAEDSGMRFDPAKNVSGNEITLPYSLTLASGDPIVYSSGGGEPIGGLEDGQTYYVIGSSPGAFKLARTEDDATAGTFITLDKTQATGRSHSIVKQGETPAGDAASFGRRVIAAETIGGFRGVAVTATNSDDIASIGASAAVAGGAGVAVGGTVDIIDVETSATIGDDAAINTLPGAPSANQSVLVAAADQFNLLLIAAAVGGGTVGVGAGVTVALIDIETHAHIGDGAIVLAAKDVAVVATGSERMTSITVAGAGGFVGVAGAVGIFIFDVETHATTGEFVTIQAGGNVLVSVADDTKLLAITGGAAGGFVGVGAGIAVTKFDKDTQASIGGSNVIDAAGNGTGMAGISNGSIPRGKSFGAVASFRGLAVQARSSEDVFGLTIALAGGFVGVAVPVGVTLMKTTTTAFIGGGTLVNLVLPANAAQSVQVAALDSFKSLTISGGVGGGFVGIGAAVDIGIADTSVSAFIGGGAVVHAAADVNVYALARKDVQTYAFAIGGGFVGIAGAVSVWTVGTAPTTSYDANAGGTGGPDSQNPLDVGSNGNSATSADSQVTGDGNGYQTILDGATPTASDNTSMRIRGVTGDDSSSGAKKSIRDKAILNAGVTATALSTTVPRGTAAAIDATVVAGGTVRIVADDNLRFKGLVGTAAGGVVGIGGSVLVANVKSSTDARLGAPASITAGGQLFIRARLDEESFALAFAGAGGLVAVGAQVAVLNDTSTQSAHVDNGAEIPTAAGGIVVEALTTREIETLAIGGSIGAVAAGASIALPSVESTTNASIGLLDGPSESGTVRITASSDVELEARSIAVNAGAFAANAAVALAEPDVTVTALLARNTFDVTGNVTIEAISSVEAEAHAISAAVGAGAVGAAIALANVDADATASMANESVMAATGTVRVSVEANLDADADVIGVTGGLGAFSGIFVEATLTGASRAIIGDGTTLT